MFEKKGLVVVGPASTDSGASFDGLFELAVDGGAEDVKEFEGEDGVEWEVSQYPRFRRVEQAKRSRSTSLPPSFPT